MLLTPVVGLAVAGLAMLFAAGSSKSSSEVLFSGQDALAPLIHDGAGWTVGALVLLVVCKGLAYAASLSSFEVGQSSRACSSGRPAASPFRTCRACP